MKKPASPATRPAILDLMKRQGLECAGEMARALGLTPMAVRLHLYDLEKEGIVVSRDAPPSPEKRGRGRPVKVWSLTGEAARVFPDAHQGLAVELIKSVEGLFGDDGLARVIAAHGARQRATYRKKLEGAKSLGERLKRLARARSDEGYMAEAGPDGEDWLFIENHCPICSAAKTCTRLCANELSVFQDVLGPDVSIVREEHILAGARRCAYRVRAA
jgi:predicted ArsR family transcriptional regulator